MKNIDLNAGGVIGGVVVAGIAAAILFAVMDTSQSGRGPYRLIMLALIGGAILGNFLWGIFFKKSK